MLTKRLDKLEQALDAQERIQDGAEGLPAEKFVFLDDEDLPTGHYLIRWNDEQLN